MVPFGAGRFNIGVLISPSSSDISHASFVDQIWPTVERLNSAVPRHARLLRQTIIVQSPTKPFVLTEKRSVKAKPTLSLYADEINEAYEKLATEGDDARSDGTAFQAYDMISTITPLVRNIVGRDILPTENLFESGRWK